MLAIGTTLLLRCREKDLNLRISEENQIYSLAPLPARPPLRKKIAGFSCQKTLERAGF